MSTELSIVESQPTHLSMVMPLADAAEAKKAIAQYEALKSAIVQESDKQQIGKETFLKKSFWRRLAACFGLSLEMVSEERGRDENGKLFYSVIYRAIAPNGRSMTADGYCSQAESSKGGWSEHNIRATAHTRAKSRATSDLVGGGEVSAEEADQGAENFAPRQPVAPARPQPPRRVVEQATPEPAGFFETVTHAEANMPAPVRPQSHRRVNAGPRVRAEAIGWDWRTMQATALDMPVEELPAPTSFNIVQQEIVMKFLEAQERAAKSAADLRTSEALAGSVRP